jgi:glucokinase
MCPARDPADLVADIGGTQARFALTSRRGVVRRVRTLKCAEHGSLSEALRAYLRLTDSAAPQRAVIAIAGPIEGDRVQMTNHVWSFSIDAVRRELGLDQLMVLNDFSALALALPALAAKDLWEIKDGKRAERAPMAVLGPGTGLGVAALVPTGDSWTPLSTEGGHRDLAAHSEREWQIVRYLRERFDHVSAERVLSGPGLVNLYEAVSRLADSEPQSLTPAAIVAGARERSSPACVEALALFAGWLGAVAGDLALTVGARGGVYLGGGILRKMRRVFDVDRFRERFLAKGRFRDYLRPIPVHAILHPQATLVGAARALGPVSSGGR